MYPTIHTWEANDLSTQGYGALSDCIECSVTEELNGAFTLEMNYPLNGIHAEYITTGNIIVAKPSHNQGKQAFRINQIKKSFANNITVYANHISYDMSGYYIRYGYTYNTLTALFTAINGFIWNDSPYYHQFTFDTDMTSSVSFTMPVKQTLRSWMGGQEGSILDTYGGEWVYDNFNVFLASRRGQDIGYRISYGKNLAEYEKEKDYNDFSHIIAFWKKSETTVFGNAVATGFTCPFRATYVDASSAFDSQPSVADLDTFAQQQISKLNPAAQTITVTPAQIGNDVIGLGDSVLICYETVLSTRVIKTVWDVLAGEYKTLQLGTLKTNITDTIKGLTTAPSGESGSVGVDYVEEQGTSGIWSYTKWASGKVEMYGKKSFSVTANVSWGSMKYAVIPSSNLPFTLTEMLYINGFATTGSGWMSGSDNTTLSQTGTFYIVRPNESAISGIIYYTVVGKWR